jgi:hypothetical protein
MGYRIEKREQENNSRPAWDIEFYNESTRSWEWVARFDLKRDAMEYLKGLYATETK